MGYVNYDLVAGTYQEGRSEVARTEDWRELVAPHLPRHGGLRVLDLGIGTGIFARVWPSWGATRVFGLDLSAAMLRTARDSWLPPDVQLLVARGEVLPFQSRVVDLVWLSAVVHHLNDRPACAHELRRVVVSGGRVMIRGFFPGTSTVGWLPFFPGAERAIERFPSVSQLEEDFAVAGFRVIAVEEAVAPAHPASAARAWVTKMRDVDTLLSAFSDDEFDAGVAALAEAGEHQLSGSLHLVVLE